MDFSGKTAIVSGAASGMGKLFAENFIRAGGNVVLCDVNDAALQEQAASLGERALPVHCDVRDYAQVTAAVDTAVERFGSVDVVTNFAGGNAIRMQKVDREKYPEFPDIPIEVFDWGIDVNLKGQFYFAHAALKKMREQKSGVIVNVGSITGAEGTSMGMDYAASKAGVMYGLTKSVAQYGAKYGVRCVCVSPGPVLTRAAMSKMKTMLGRAAEPQEIIDLVMYLISDKAAFITGENIMIDGGRNAMTREKH